MNTERKPLDDIRVRIALQIAINPQEIAEEYIQGYAHWQPYGITGAGAVNNGYDLPFEEWPEELKANYTYNPDRAKELLAAAGYPDGFEFVPDHSPDRDLDLYQLIAAYWADIGVTANIKTVEGSAIVNKAQAGEFDMTFGARGVGVIFPALWWGWALPIEYTPFLEDPLENLGNLIVPSVVLGAALSASTMRFTRTMMLEVLGQDYIRTAWARGLRERIVIVRYALKNSLIPVVTVIGSQIPILVGGAVIVEQVFTLPGMGRFMVDALSLREYNIVTGINLVIAVVVVVTNLLIDLTYAYLDPRVRYE